jgi:benzoyl-CoA reductase/2-hydroxyglutaryl-CoA dehydratase subunit BcrC/BadD/HgdB
MGYFDFVMSEVHGLRIKELLDEKAAGRKIIGSYCVFVPRRDRSGSQRHPGRSLFRGRFRHRGCGKLLPRNTCALIKSSFGFKIGKVCPTWKALT